MTLKENPFYILDVTPDDSLETINEKCEDKAFMDEANEELYRDARHILSSPVKRLTAEVRWLYDIEQSVEDFLDELDFLSFTGDSQAEISEYELSDTRENLLANIEKIACVSESKIAKLLKVMDIQYSEICTDEYLARLIKKINVHRKTAGIPLCHDIELVKMNVVTLLDDITAMLNCLFSYKNNKDIVEFANDLLKSRYDYGKVTDKFVNLYAINFSDTLREYQERILNEIEDAKKYDEEYELDYLCELTREFDHFAQPIQLLLHEYGQSKRQRESIIVADKIRELSIFYNNQKKLPGMALCLLNLEMELFSELPDIYSRLREDKKILERLVKETARDSYIKKMIAEMKAGVIHDESSAEINRKFLQPRFSEYIQCMINYITQVTAGVQKGTEEYSDISYTIALFYTDIACNCTWADMWEESLETYNKALLWAERTNDKQFVVDIRKSQMEVQEVVSHRRRRKAEKQAEQQQLYYEGEWGLIFKDKIKISHLGVEYGRTCIPLEEIKRAKWGAVRKSVNYIPTGTDYTIVVESDDKYIRIAPNEEVYLAFLDKLWKAVAGNIISNILTAFRDGKDTGFDKDIHDTGVHYIKWNWFSKNEEFEYGWSQISVGCYDGDLCLYNPDGKCILSISLMDTFNTYFLDAIIRLAHEKKVKKLSDLLR